jgi:hypothetical protein
MILIQVYGAGQTRRRISVRHRLLLLLLLLPLPPLPPPLAVVFYRQLSIPIVQHRNVPTPRFALMTLSDTSSTRHGSAAISLGFRLVLVQGAVVFGYDYLGAADDVADGFSFQTKPAVVCVLLKSFSVRDRDTHPRSRARIR